MPFDENQEKEFRARADDEDRPPGLLWWLMAMAIGAAMWAGLWFLASWLLGMS